MNFRKGGGHSYPKNLLHIFIPSEKNTALAIASEVGTLVFHEKITVVKSGLLNSYSRAGNEDENEVYRIRLLVLKS